MRDRRDVLLESETTHRAERLQQSDRVHPFPKFGGSPHGVLLRDPGGLLQGVPSRLVVMFKDSDFEPRDLGVDASNLFVEEIQFSLSSVPLPTCDPELFL